MHSPIAPTFWTIPDVANIMQVTPATVRRWVREGRLKDRKVPGTRKILILASELESLTNENEKAA